MHLKKKPLIFGHVGGKKNNEMSVFFFLSGIISLRLRTKPYSESGLKVELIEI